MHFGGNDHEPGNAAAGKPASDFGAHAQLAATKSRDGAPSGRCHGRTRGIHVRTLRGVRDPLLAESRPQIGLFIPSGKARE